MRWAGGSAHTPGQHCLVGRNVMQEVKAIDQDINAIFIASELCYTLGVF
ncbi:hypothetical protein ABDB91_01070 [Desulfoscipio sp. XC116]